MAATKIDWPSPTNPSTDTDYTYQNDNLEESIKTINAINLTNWDTGTAAPAVEAGSAIESLGNVYRFASSESISTSGASSGTLYLIFDTTTQTLSWTNTTPTWNSTYRGYYVGDDRFTGHQCEWDGVSTFTEKFRWVSDNRNGDAALISSTTFKVPGTLDIGSLDSSSWTGTYSTQSITNGSTWTPSSGLYMMVGDSTANTFGIQISSDGGTTWFPPSGNLTAPSGLVAADGTNYRIVNNSGGTRTVYYRQI